MKHLFFSTLLLALGLAPLACDEDDDDMDTGADTANDGADDESAGPADDGADDGADGAATSSSMETCDSVHECINDVCECTTPGKEDQPCTDDEACVAECEVCM